MNSTLPKTKTTPLSTHSPEVPDGFFFNILPFSHPQTTIEVNFTPMANARMARFDIKRLPAALQKQLWEKRGFIPAFVYTSFSPSAGGCTVQVNLAEFPAVARAYYTKIIRDKLAPQIPLMRSNFLNDTQYWCLLGQQKYAHYTTYDKFTLRVQFDFTSNQPELLISYDGQSFVLKKSLAGLTDVMEPNTQLLESVAWKDDIYRWKYLPEDALYNHDEIYPVVNRELAEHLGLEFPFELISNKMDVIYEKINMFYKKYCSGNKLKSVIIHDGRWKSAGQSVTGQLKATERKLEFGRQGIHTDPYQGIKLYGPLKLPEGKHFSYFFIYFQDQENSARRLYKYILKQEGFIRISEFTRIPVKYENKKNIVILNDEDPEAKVAECLQKMSLVPSVKYFAFYVSPYTRFENDEKKKAVYYRIKERLLYRNISMQAVENHKLEKEFKYSVSNIGIALIAKLGGIPWKLEGSGNRELVIGFGAYQTGTFGIRYTGSAVCFSQDGMFREFDVFPATNTNAIAVSAVEAFQKYRENNPDADRIIIHFYKRMSKDELKPLERMLSALKFDIPVIVAGISKTPSKSLLMFDNPGVNAMPVDGTWARIRQSEYLLNINLRKQITINDVKQTLPLKINLQCNREGYLDDDGTVEQLLEQVYAFSFMHWRSVSQSPLPVTVKYPAMIASFMPWFRNKNLTRFGRTVPWFL